MPDYLKKTAAIILTSALVLTSPGPFAMQAFAQTVRPIVPQGRIGTSHQTPVSGMQSPSGQWLPAASPSLHALPAMQGMQSPRLRHPQ